MGFDVLEDTNTTNIVAAGDEDRGTVVEFDDTIDITSFEVKL